MGIKRYGLRDDQWERIENLLPGRKGTVGRPATDNLSPRAVNNIRKRIVEMASQPEPSQAGAKWLLEMIEIW